MPLNNKIQLNKFNPYLRFHTLNEGEFSKNIEVKSYETNKL